MFDCIVKSKIIPAKPVVSRLLIGKDGEGVKATEYQKGIIPGQVIVDVETGEVTDGIIDFKKIGEKRRIENDNEGVACCDVSQGGSSIQRDCI